MDVETKSRGSSQRRNILAITTLVLTLLLTVTVSSFIYFTLTQQHHAANQPEITRQGSLRMSDEADEKSSAEEMSYYKAENLVVYRTSDGSFESAQDYNKGILYHREPETGRCYLTPVSSKPEDGHEFENYLAHNETVSVIGRHESFTVLDGEITDTSFIPEAVQKECGEGYHWLVNSPQSEGRSLVKRGDGWIIIIIIRCCSCRCGGQAGQP